jgi:2-dehydro-3-deoxyphosphogluconate aldolase/(4S)-4-hydroxy-2-oxoglutarate aldolase
MLRFTRIQTCQIMAATGLILVFYHNDLETSRLVVKACYEGGVRAFEFINRGDVVSVFFVKGAKAHALDKYTGNRSCCPYRGEPR